MARNKWRASLIWLSVCLLFVLCGVLGMLQYRWIGQASVADRERLGRGLQWSLEQLSQEFNSEITAACRSLLSSPTPVDMRAAEREIAARYREWKSSGHRARIFHRIAIAQGQDGTIVLRSLDSGTGLFATSEWPPEWKGIHDGLQSSLAQEPWPGRNPFDRRTEGEGLLFVVPLWGMRPGGGPPGPPALRDMRFAILEFNVKYVRDVLLPELVQRHLGVGGVLDYEVQVVSNTSTPSVIYQSDPNQRTPFGADASIGLFDLRYDRILRPWGPAQPQTGRPEPPEMRERAGRPGPGPDFGRWRMSVRNRAGSLDAVVSQARRRNLAVTAGVLLLMLASVSALIRFTRRAQRLAELQMSFVAGVSHELRTPLTVIHTAAYNLCGRIAGNPVQVERYGALIQQESGRLKELVEQVLRFSSAKAGHVIRKREPLSVGAVIEETVESSRAVIEQSRCTVETNIDPELPPIVGDPIALTHALQNLLSNAAKYGAGQGNWIGVFASTISQDEDPVIEIRVADRGPGIPADEQERIFEPFFRGKRALEDQIHGTGLGLSLAKEIIEAHGGSIFVHSEPSKGTEFVVHIPAATAGALA